MMRLEQPHYLVNFYLLKPTQLREPPFHRLEKKEKGGVSNSPLFVLVLDRI